MLYSQMEDALGRYFNRRARQRVRPEMDRPLSAHFSSRGQVMWGTVYDLSTKGMGLVVDHVEAARLTKHAEGTVRFQLPDSKKDLEGSVFIRQHRRLREQDMVGLEFDLEQAGGFADHQAELAEYCAEREKRMTELEVSWEGTL
jgi:c-di-GMP-binding flagellar brake protein YcgR